MGFLFGGFQVKIATLLSFLIGFTPILAEQQPGITVAIDSDLKPLVWEHVVEKANVLKERQQKEKRFAYAVNAAQMASLLTIACWVFCVWPSEQMTGTIKGKTLEVPDNAKGFILTNIMKGVFGAISFFSMNFFVKAFERLGSVAKTGGTTLAASVGIIHNKPVYKVEKYLEIVTELSESLIATVKEYSTISDNQKVKQLHTLQTNIIILLDSLEIMLARMLIEVEIIRKQSRYLARAATDTIHQTFDTTNQSVVIIRERFEKQESIADVLEHWSAIIKKSGKSFKQYAGMTDTH